MKTNTTGSSSSSRDRCNRRLRAGGYGWYGLSICSAVARRAGHFEYICTRSSSAAGRLVGCMYITEAARQGCGLQHVKQDQVIHLMRC